MREVELSDLGGCRREYRLENVRHAISPDAGDDGSRR